MSPSAPARFEHSTRPSRASSKLLMMTTMVSTTMAAYWAPPRCTASHRHSIRTRTPLPHVRSGTPWSSWSGRRRRSRWSLCCTCRWCSQLDAERLLGGHGAAIATANDRSVDPRNTTSGSIIFGDSMTRRRMQIKLHWRMPGRVAHVWASFGLGENQTMHI